MTPDERRRSLTGVADGITVHARSSSRDPSIVGVMPQPVAGQVVTSHLVGPADEVGRMEPDSGRPCEDDFGDHQRETARVGEWR